MVVKWHTQKAVSLISEQTLCPVDKTGPIFTYDLQYAECSSGFSCIKTQSGKKKRVKSAANPSKYKNTD